MIPWKTVFGIWLLFTALDLLAVESFDTLKIRKTFEVDSFQFKLGITQFSEWEYKIHISKKLQDKWVLQNRLIKDTEFYEGYEFADWNKDGFSDIRLYFVNGGNPSHEDILFLYDSIDKTFRNVELFWWYCGSHEKERQVNHILPYYYNFIERGCSGSLYESTFFTVENFKIKPIGTIRIDYCDAPFQIYIYRYITGNKIRKSATIPLSYVERFYDDGPFNQSWQNYVAHFWLKHGFEFAEIYSTEQTESPHETSNP